MSRLHSCLAVASVLALSLVSAGCARKPAREPVSETLATAGRLGSGVRVSEDLVKICQIQFGNVDRAPRFDFDESALLPEDRDVLEQIAKCVTTGPLKGRGLSLIGRADPRGELEYNMILGENRADTVRDYLAHLGVDGTLLAKTSRGELDADGKDEDGWRRDRRVDILLK